MTDLPPTVRDPQCPICKQPLFGRVIWFPEVGSSHDSCVLPLVQDEIAARALIDEPASP